MFFFTQINRSNRGASAKQTQKPRANLPGSHTAPPSLTGSQAEPRKAGAEHRKSAGAAEISQRGVMERERAGIGTRRAGFPFWFYYRLTGWPQASHQSALGFLIPPSNKNEVLWVQKWATENINPQIIPGLESTPNSNCLTLSLQKKKKSARKLFCVKNLPRPSRG